MKRRWMMATLAILTGCAPIGGMAPAPGVALRGPTGNRVDAPVPPDKRAFDTQTAPVPVSLPQPVGDRMVVEPTRVPPPIATAAEWARVADDLGLVRPVIGSIPFWGGGAIQFSRPPNVPPTSNRARSVPRLSWQIGRDLTMSDRGRVCRYTGTMVVGASSAHGSFSLLLPWTQSALSFVTMTTMFGEPTLRPDYGRGLASPCAGWEDPLLI